MYLSSQWENTLVKINGTAGKVWGTQWPNIKKKDLFWKFRRVQGAVFNQNSKAYTLKKFFFAVQAKINGLGISESWVNPGNSLE